MIPMIPMTILVAGPGGPCDQIFCYFLVFPISDVSTILWLITLEL